MEAVFSVVGASSLLGNPGGVLMVTDSRFVGNTASGSCYAQGGAVFIDYYTGTGVKVLIRNTDFVDNTATGQIASDSSGVFWYGHQTAHVDPGGGPDYASDQHLHGGSPCSGRSSQCGSMYGQCLGNGEDQSFYWE